MSSPSSDPNAIAELYQKRARDFEAQRETWSVRSRLVSNLRGLAFGTAVIAAGFAWFGGAGQIGAAVAVCGVVAFLGFVFWHARVIEREEELSRWARVNHDAHARVTERWRELPEQGERFLDPKHPYGSDLDVFGPSSLYQRLCVAHTLYGQRTLAGWLAEPSDTQEIRKRQAAAKVLGPELDLRQHLEALSLAVAERHDAPDRGKKARRQAPNPEPFLHWAETAPELSASPLLPVVARLLPIVTVGGLIASAGFGAPALAWGIPLILQIALNYLTREPTTRVFLAVSSTEGAFLRYGAMLELIESIDLDSELTRALKQRLLAQSERPSAAMKDFKRAVGWFDMRHNGLIHPFANAFLLWDINCVLALEGWQRRSGKGARLWFEVLGEFEALSSIAGLHHDEPGFVFPEITGGAVFEAEGLGHPLIGREKRVPNDVSLPEAGRALLITGSNMSGKSTLLRAMGLAVVMGLAGCPVCARRLRVGDVAVRTSVRISDSLESGVSHFYAELAKLKAVLDATAESRPVFFLLDEILHGTNSRERQLGARWMIAELIRRNATGAVTTHDMGLVELPPELSARVELVHFREEVKDGAMTFDYKLRPGPVTAGNALRLMRKVGLDVPLDDGEHA